MTQSFPSFEELKEFIKKNQHATILEICKKFGQLGDSVISTMDGRTELVLAYGVNREFFEYLQSFMKEEYVQCNEDPFACLISDDTRYVGKGKFLPITLSINEGGLFDYPW